MQGELAFDDKLMPIAPIIIAPSDTVIDLEWSEYKLARSVALWFAARSDDYESRTHLGAIYIPKGHTKLCAEEHYADCLKLWQRLSVRDAGHFPTGMIHVDATNALSADSSNATNCLCLDCLRKELDRLARLRA